MQFIYSGLFFIGALAYFLLALSSLIDTNFFVVELFSHFQLQYFITGFFFLIVLISISPLRLFSIGLMVLALGVNFVNLWPYLPLSAHTTSTTQHSYSLLQANVFKFNTKTQPLIDLIYKTNPDIIALSEITHAWDKDLEVILDDWPYAFVSPEEGSHGMAIYSKIPFEQAHAIDIGYQLIPAFTVTYPEFTLVSIHTLPPISQSFYKNRNLHFDWIVDNFDNLNSSPLVVAGDMNVTMFAPKYKTFLKDTNLRNARENRGIQNTWSIFGQWATGIPIDHFLHNTKIKIHTSAVMPDINSDHLPILTTFSVRR